MKQKSIDIKQEFANILAFQGKDFAGLLSFGGFFSRIRWREYFFLFSSLYIEATNSHWYAWRDRKNCCISKELLTKNWVCVTRTLLGVPETTAFPIFSCAAGKSSQWSVSVEEERGHCCLPPLGLDSQKSKMYSCLIYSSRWPLEHCQHTPTSVGLQGEGVLGGWVREGWGSASYRCQISAGQWSLGGPNWLSQVRASLDCSVLVPGPGLEPVAESWPWRLSLYFCQDAVYSGSDLAPAPCPGAGKPCQGGISQGVGGAEIKKTIQCRLI